MTLPIPRRPLDEPVDEMTERLMHLLEILHPGKSRDWLIEWLCRAAWFYDHEGSLRRCPYDPAKFEAAA